MSSLYINPRIKGQIVEPINPTAVEVPIPKPPILDGNTSEV